MNAFFTVSDDLSFNGSASVILFPRSTTTNAYLKPISFGKNNKSACWV
eukprot:gene8572-10544_t